MWPQIVFIYCLDVQRDKEKLPREAAKTFTWIVEHSKVIKALNIKYLRTSHFLTLAAQFKYLMSRGSQAYRQNSLMKKK